jgi:sigma-B regulation protein RsbU (phosphoserine phosphatase)
LNVNVPAGHHPTAEESTLLSSLANIVAMTLQRREAERDLRAKEVQLLAAGEIQKYLLPKESVRLPGFSLEGRCYPAEFAAGDHFDYLRLPDGSLLVVLGDVSGHGVGPAIITAAFHTQFQALAEQSSDLAEMVAKVNATLHAATGAELFITMIAGRIDPASRTLTYLNAGHPAGIVLDSSGAVKASLESNALPLGILPDDAFEPGGTIQLAAGDIVLFVTDGLLEAQPRGCPMFGMETALQVVREHRDATAAEIIESLYHAVCRYLGTEKPHDDITAVVVKVEPHEETQLDKP